MATLMTEPKIGPRVEHREGPVARTIEQQTAKLPSDTFLWAALGSIGLSLAFQAAKKTEAANFVGHSSTEIFADGFSSRRLLAVFSAPFLPASSACESRQISLYLFSSLAHGSLKISADGLARMS